MAAHGLQDRRGPRPGREDPRALRDELLTLRAGRGSIDQDAYVFATGRGGRVSDDNFRSRVLRATVMRANENLERADLPPLPDKLTPHSLRRTFCSLLYALGEDPGTVMDEWATPTRRSRSGCTASRCAAARTRRRRCGRWSRAVFGRIWANEAP